MHASGSSGTIHEARAALHASDFRFSREDLERTLLNFGNTGHNVLVEFASCIAVDFAAAIDRALPDAEAAISAVAVVSDNPAVPLVGFASGLVDSGAKFFIPPDRVIRHGTNIAGYLDALPDIEDKARTDPKTAALLRLYRASLRESSIDNQLLFQLILLEEASDREKGDSFGKRLRAYLERHRITEHLAHIAQEAAVTIPAGKDAVDLIVALRNVAAHNGEITAAGLTEWRAAWAVPLVDAKGRVHRLVSDVLRNLFCSLVGKSMHDNMTLVSGPLEIRFD